MDVMTTIDNVDVFRERLRMHYAALIQELGVCFYFIYHPIDFFSPTHPQFTSELLNHLRDAFSTETVERVRAGGYDIHQARLILMELYKRPDNELYTRFARYLQVENEGLLRFLQRDLLHDVCLSIR